jgi:hypothetical protein
MSTTPGYESLPDYDSPYRSNRKRKKQRGLGRPKESLRRSGAAVRGWETRRRKKRLLLLPPDGPYRAKILDVKENKETGALQMRMKVAGVEVTAGHTPASAELVDMVNHPPHYQAYDRYGNKHETVDCCEAHNLTSAEAQAVQYIMRARKKGNYIEDMKKAIWWATRALENEQYKMEPPK